MYKKERCDNEACGNKDCGLNNPSVELNCEGGEQDIGVCSFYCPEKHD